MNHPHEQQAPAMARAGELTDGEQLRECINSGQVSAAQVVAHAEDGEVTTGWPPGMLQDDSRQLSKALSRDPNARALAREAVELPPLPSNMPYVTRRIRACESEVPAQLVLEHAMRAYATAALAAERAEVARLREALQNLLGGVGECLTSRGERVIDCPVGVKAREVLYPDMINPTQGATNHD